MLFYNAAMYFQQRKEVLMLLYKKLEYSEYQKNEVKVEKIQTRVIVTARGTKSLKLLKMHSDVAIVSLENEDVVEIFVYKLMW